MKEVFSLPLSREVEGRLFWTNCLIEAAKDLEGNFTEISENGAMYYDFDTLVKNTTPLSRNEEGFTPLMSAAKEGNLEVFRKLEMRVTKDDYYSLIKPDNYNKNILHYAVMSNRQDMVDNVIQAIEMTNKQEIIEEALFYEDDDNQNPLDLAVLQRKDLSIVKTLIDIGAVSTYAVLMKAAIYYKEAADLLIESESLIKTESGTVVDDRSIINTIVENIDEIIVKAPDNGTSLLEILECLQDKNIQNLFNKNSVIIAAYLLDDGSDLIENYNKKVDENHKITKIQRIEIDRIKGFYCEVLESLKGQQSTLIPEVAATVAAIDLIRERVLVEKEEENSSWQSSKYNHPEMSSEQIEIIDNLINKFFPAKSLEEVSSFKQSSSKSNNCTIS